jgi:hypothetical protein
MYEDGEQQIKAILVLVDLCPEAFKQTAFEVLLQGYVDAQSPRAPKDKSSSLESKTEDKGGHPGGSASSIPAESLARFKNMARRLEVSLEALEALFDFSVEPFGFHAFSVPGKNNADKTRNVALLVAAKSYLANGSWVADWKEVKARTVDQNAYDAANHAKVLRQGEGSLFRSVEAGKNLELPADGVKAAEALLKQLATAT